MQFIGRDAELKDLNELYQSNNSSLIVIYGRRRIGKTTLVEKFIAKKPHLRFEGLEQGGTQAQLSQVVYDFGKQINNPLLSQVKIEAWAPLLDHLTKIFSQSKEKYILFLDEFQWLAANQSKLVSLIKKYWDQCWSKQKVMLILCGSVCAYMIKNVVGSKALYGRITQEMCLEGLSPIEIYQLLEGKCSIDEILQYSIVLGGIPQYLKELNPHQSLDQNINRLFLTKNGSLVNDYQGIFFSQFKKPHIYEKIVRYLQGSPKSLQEIATKLKMTSSGGVKLYLANLEKALFITSYTPYDKTGKTKLIKYKLTDEYLRFYYKYVEPNRQLILANQHKNLFAQLVKPVWQTWLSCAFENFCLRHAWFLADLMGFQDELIQWGPYFHRQDIGFQIDLLYLRKNKIITLCELKYQDAPISVQVVREVEKKAALITLPRGYVLEKALISRLGPDKSLKELGYFQHTIQQEDFFSQ